MNLDRRTGFALTPETVFPVVDGSAPIVYSSHCFEHLDDATVDRMLVEARRVLAPDGVLVLKLPDFDEVLRCWRFGVESYFDKWGMQKVIPTWHRMGVEPTIDAKAAFIFCGWWNDAYGDEFGDRHPEREGAYHGPAVTVDPEYPLSLSESPHTIAKWFVSCVPQGAHFNHRNAWSAEEMRALLKDHGFRLDEPPERRVVDWRGVPEIPGLWDQCEISMYFFAR